MPEFFQNLLGSLAGASIPIGLYVWARIRNRKALERAFRASIKANSEPGTIRLKGDQPADTIADQVRRRQWPMA